MFCINCGKKIEDGISEGDFCSSRCVSIYGDFCRDDWHDDDWHDSDDEE